MTDTRGMVAVALACFFVAVGSTTGYGQGQGQGPAQPAHPKPAAAALHAKYQIDAPKSRLIVETQTSGLSAMFAHDHKMEVHDFSGTVSLTPSTLANASLKLTVKASSLRLLEDKSIGERQAIESALREDVLETAKYPEITFKSSRVTTERRGDGSFDVRLTGELFLHGVRRQVTIPARLSVQPDSIRVIGVVDIRQTDFKITPFSFVGGTVVIKDTVTISFDIVANAA